MHDLVTSLFPLDFRCHAGKGVHGFVPLQVATSDFKTTCLELYVHRPCTEISLILSNLLNPNNADQALRYSGK